MTNEILIPLTQIFLVTTKRVITLYTNLPTICPKMNTDENK